MQLEQTNDLPKDDPRHHAMNLAYALREIARHAREDIMKVEDPAGRELFETTAEVLLGLAAAHEHFAEGVEPTLESEH
jgi:hypothetical protein